MHDDKCNPNLGTTGVPYNTKSSTFKWSVYVHVCCCSLKVSSRCFKWILAVPTSHCQSYMLPTRCDLPLLAPKTPTHGILGPHHGMWHLCCYGDARERWEDAYVRWWSLLSFPNWSGIHIWAFNGRSAGNSDVTPRLYYKLRFPHLRHNTWSKIGW